MGIEHSYEVAVDWIEDRVGILNSPDLNDDLQVATPPEFPKGVDRIWSPEHLFTAAVNSCLMTTFLSIADNSKLEFKTFTSKAYGKLEMKDGKYVMSEITLMPVLTISKAEDRDKALKILQKSEAACLISNSIKSAIIFKPEVLTR
jgi:organic hydroperoxide reductase OsmC/OhrA